MISNLFIAGIGLAFCTTGLILFSRFGAKMWFGWLSVAIAAVVGFGAVTDISSAPEAGDPITLQISFTTDMALAVLAVTPLLISLGAAVLRTRQVWLNMRFHAKKNTRHQARQKGKKKSQQRRPQKAREKAAGKQAKPQAPQAPQGGDKLASPPQEMKPAETPPQTPAKPKVVAPPQPVTPAAEATTPKAEADKVAEA